MVSELLSKYIWLVQTLTAAGRRGLLLEEVTRLWERRWGESYSRRTFLNHRTAIGEVFDLNIVCDRRTNRYYVSGVEDIRRDGKQWMIDNFTVGNLLNLSNEGLRGRVAVEPVPSGRKWLTPLVDALLSCCVLRLGYRKYTSQETDFVHVHPYGLKEFERRWYLVAYARERGALRVYGLDRIESMESLPETFQMPGDFDLDSVFTSSFGIYLPEGREPQRILLAATSREARYLRDLPLHPSQEEIPGDAGGERPCRFSLRLIPNEAFVMEICRHRAGLEVLEPPSLRSAVAASLASSHEMYKDQI